MDGYSISKNTSPILLSNYTTKICHDLRQIVSYYIKLVTTSWTYSIYCVQTMWSIAISKKCALPRNTKHKGIFLCHGLLFYCYIRILHFLHDHFFYCCIRIPRCKIFPVKFLGLCQGHPFLKPSGFIYYVRDRELYVRFYVIF